MNFNVVPLTGVELCCRGNAVEILIVVSVIDIPPALVMNLNPGVLIDPVSLDLYGVFVRN